MAQAFGSKATLLSWFSLFVLHDNGMLVTLKLQTLVDRFQSVIS